MSIASEITKAQTNLSNCYTACQNKGATIPQAQNFDNLSTCISSITGGGSSDNEYIYAWTCISGIPQGETFFSNKENLAVGDTVKKITFAVNTNTSATETTATVDTVGTTTIDSCVFPTIKVQNYTYIYVRRADLDITRKLTGTRRTLNISITGTNDNGWISYMPNIKNLNFDTSKITTYWGRLVSGMPSLLYLPPECRFISVRCGFYQLPFNASSSSNIYPIYQDNYYFTGMIIDTSQPVTLTLEGDY